MSEPPPDYSSPAAPDPTSTRPFECLDCDGVFEERAKKWAYNERADGFMWCCPYCGAGYAELIPSNRQVQ
jgi:hypothetical protein